jgi:hypothetical protein
LAQQFEPTYLEPLVAVSKKLTLAEGEKRVVDLRIGSMPLSAQSAVRDSPGHYH